jgi:glutamate/tyrosine decarboxylase-like PLP-dependent enzyme
MSHSAPYLLPSAEARDEIDWTPEWSRRARGFATYAALKQLGRSGISLLVEQCCRHATALVAQLAELPAVELVWEPIINQGMVRFLDPAAGATDRHHDRFTDRVVQEILARGDSFFMATTWQGRRAMRVSVLNWQTTEADLAVAVESVHKCLEKVRAASVP